jgi:hypothetical protein
VKLRNASSVTGRRWERNGQPAHLLGNHWLDENNRPLVNDDGRSILLYDLKPGEEIELPLTVTAPRRPVGTFWKSTSYRKA